jgi:hypothetical protein
VNAKQLELHIEALRVAADEVAHVNDTMDDAFAEESDARRRLLTAVCEAVAPAIPAIADGTAVFALNRSWGTPPSGTMRLACPVVELDARRGVHYLLGRHPEVEDFFFLGTTAVSLEDLCPDNPDHTIEAQERQHPGGLPCPRELRLDGAIGTLGTRLRAALRGKMIVRTQEARRLADRLSAIEILLRSP